MKKSDGEGQSASIIDAHASNEGGRTSSLARAFSFPAPLSVVDGVKVIPLSNILKLALPPLFLSSLPKRAIGFSFPRGTEGKLLGVALVGGTAALSYLLNGAFGIYAALAMVWLMGGTGVVILYNSTSHGLAFVKQMCSTCRLRPIIVEHEVMHLNGERSEEVVWEAARKKYTYDGLGLGTDPKIHSFCPIAKRLKDTP
jgi:hypothetical protein